MYIDQTLIFSSAQAITASADSTNIVDLTGAGINNATNLLIGNATVFGADMGVGDGMAVPKIQCGVSVAFTTLTSLQVAAQFAPDNGSNGAGSYATYAQTGAIAVADLIAGAEIGTFDLPRMPTATDALLTDYPLPRFLKLRYTVVGSNASTGKVNANIVLQKDAQLGGVQAAANYIVAA